MEGIEDRKYGTEGTDRHGNGMGSINAGSFRFVISDTSMLCIFSASCVDANSIQ